MGRESRMNTTLVPLEPSFFEAIDAVLVTVRGNVERSILAGPLNDEQAALLATSCKNIERLRQVFSDEAGRQARLGAVRTS